MLNLEANFSITEYNFKRTQAFANPSDLASSGIWKNVFLCKTFCHTPDEARSVGLVKACVLPKSYSVIEKLASTL